MASLNLEDMQQIQKELQAKYLEKWGRPFSENRSR